MEVEAINAVHAKVGDRVVLSLKTASLLKTAFLLYVFPIILMIVGAVIGQETAPILGVDPSGFSVILAILCFIAAFFVVRGQSHRLTAREDFRPRIIKIKR